MPQLHIATNQPNAQEAGLYPKQYTILGDVNFAALLPLTRRGSNRKYCNGDLQLFTDIQLSQGLHYIVDRVNSDRILPLNLTLGFTVLDDCFIPGLSILQSLSLFNKKNCFRDHVFNPKAVAMNNVPFVAIVGPGTASRSENIARLWGAVDVPVLGFQTTSNKLSDSSSFPSFIRTIPSDRINFLALTALVKHIGWNLISVVYMDTDVAGDKLQELEMMFKSISVCFANLLQVHHKLLNKDINSVVNHLFSDQSTRVVILLLPWKYVKLLLHEMENKCQNEKFTMIAVESWPDFEIKEELLDIKNKCHNVFFLGPRFNQTISYNEWIRERTMDMDADPWFGEYWGKRIDCQVDDITCTANIPGSMKTSIAPSPYVSFMFDAVYMIAYAIRNIIIEGAHKFCRRMQTGENCDLLMDLGYCCNSSVYYEIANIISPKKIKRMLHSSTQRGLEHSLEYDVNREYLGDYVIKQLKHIRQNSEKYIVETVGVYNSKHKKLNIVEHINIVMLRSMGICNQNCRLHEVTLTISQSLCCWRCYACHPNERLVENSTDCEKCPIFTWPDKRTNYSTCTPIQPLTMADKKVYIGFMTIVSGIGILVCLLMALFLYRKRNSRVIKASSRELSALMLIGILMGYIVILTLSMPANTITCKMNFFMCNLSLTLIYAPMVVRIVRIYRIFKLKSGTISIRKLSCVSPTTQVSLACGILAIVCLNNGLIFIFEKESWTSVTQASRIEPLIEKSCRIPQSSLLVNIPIVLLVLICAVLAFKTRQLPNNFNETRYVFLCAIGTFLVTLGFIPSIILTKQELLKTLMYALMIGVHHTVALIFILFSKVRAVIFKGKMMSQMRFKVKLTSIAMAIAGPESSIFSQTHTSTTAYASFIKKRPSPSNSRAVCFASHTSVVSNPTCNEPSEKTDTLSKWNKS